jgi:hypothetical protein
VELQLRINNGSLCFDSPNSPPLSYETKHVIMDESDNPTEWSFQIFPVQARYGLPSGRVLLMLKQGKKKRVKSGQVQVNLDGTLTLDTDPATPVDAVGEEFDSIRAQLPQLDDYKWVLHRTTKTVRTKLVSPGIKVLHNARAQVAILGDTVRDEGCDYPAEFVFVMAAARWLVVHRGNMVSDVHLWPGAGEYVEEIVEAVNRITAP